MDKKEAKELLNQIHNTKKAFASLSPETDKLFRKDNNREAFKTLAKTLLLAAGGGAAIRGLSGIRNILSSDPEPVPARTVDMPIIYGRKKEKVANAKLRSPYYIPGMLLGAPLAAYGGWKAIDAVLDRQRRLKTEEELEEAKKNYEQAVLSSYKQGSELSSEELLDEVFSNYKAASVQDWMDTAKGLGLTYALATAPLGYMVVNSAMRKKSKRKILEKAMRERARMQAQKQPAELYAIPEPRDMDENE